MVDTDYRVFVVMRHAKTETAGQTDRARRLTDRGRADAGEAGRWMLDVGLRPDLVLVSPAARTRATADLVVSRLSTEHVPRVEVVDALYGADPTEVLDAVRESVEGDEGCVLVIGHNPTMAELAHALQADPATPLSGHLPTAGVRVLETVAGWHDLASADATLSLSHDPSHAG
jgi:phosphohistidine phosphatase